MLELRLLFRAAWAKVIGTLVSAIENSGEKPESASNNSISPLVSKRRSRVLHSLWGWRNRARVYCLQPGAKRRRQLKSRDPSVVRTRLHSRRKSARSQIHLTGSHAT